MHCAIYTAMQYDIGGTVACKLICEYPWGHAMDKKGICSKRFFCICQFAVKNIDVQPRHIHMFHAGDATGQFILEGRAEVGESIR